MTEEKRRFSRIVFNVRARLETYGLQLDFDRIANLSVGGCRLETASLTTDLRLGQDVVVKIFLDHMAPVVQIAGEIVRTDGREISVKFTSIDPENLFHLQNIIRYNSENTQQVEHELYKHPGLK